MRVAAKRLIAVSLALTASTTLARACHCLHGPEALMSRVIATELKERHGILVDAKVLANGTGAAAHMTTFKVFHTWAGKSGKTITVRHNLNGEACGIKFTVGQRLFLLATPDDTGVLTTTMCSERLAELAKSWGKERVHALAK